MAVRAALCAPCQDADVESLRTESLAEPTPARALSTLLCRADAVLSVTEALNRKARDDLRQREREALALRQAADAAEAAMRAS